MYQQFRNIKDFWKNGRQTGADLQRYKNKEKLQLNIGKAILRWEE